MGDIYEIKTLDELIPLLDSEKLLGFDTETDGLYGKICVSQFYQQHWEKAVLVLNPDPYHLAAILKPIKLIGHTIHYDISTIQAQTQTDWIPDAFDDTFYAARLHYYHKESFSLDNVLLYSLGYDPYDQFDLDKKTLQKSNWTGLLTEKQLLYAAIDVFYLFDCIEVIQPAFEEFNYKLDIHFTRHCLNFQTVGLPVESDKLLALWNKNIARIEEINLPVNANSWKQVRPYIGEEESDALALATFAIQGNKKAAAVNETRKLIKLNSFLKKFDVDEGKIFGRFLPSTRSGRCASKEQNLEQLPRKSKGVFGVKPDSGKILIYADFAQLELRCICVITQETRMEKLFRAGEDLHGYTAAMLFGKDYTKRDRQIGKTCNFNLLYGGSANMLGSILIKDANILLPEYELQEIKRSWHKLWPTITAWQGRGINAWKNKTPWQTPLGRKYIGNLMTDQLNIQVQGFGAEVAKLATHYMMPRFTEIHESIKVCNFIHDSWILECDNDPEIYKSAAKVLASSMQEAWQECSKSVKIKDLPMPVDVFVGYNWGDIENEDILNVYEYKVN